MKNRCPICGTQKAKRRCKRREMAEICPTCCASQRDETCGDCAHRMTAQRYEAERLASGTLPGGHFVAEISPEVESAVNQALELAQRGKVDQAQTALKRLLSENLSNHAVLFGMGVLHIMRGEHKESIAWFDKATAIFPYFMEAYFNKALACRTLLDLSGAIRASRKVVEVGAANELEVKQAKTFLKEMADSIFKTEGVDLDAYLESQESFMRAFDLMEKGEWEGALAGFRAAAAKNDRNVPTHGNMGLCLAKLGHKAEALMELDRALEMDSRYEPAKVNRLAVEQMQEDVPMAEAEFRSVSFGKEQFLAKQQGHSWRSRLAEMFGRAKDRED